MNMIRYCISCGKGLRMRWANLNSCDVWGCNAPLCNHADCKIQHMGDLHPDRRPDETAGP